MEPHLPQRTRLVRLGAAGLTLFLLAWLDVTVGGLGSRLDIALEDWLAAQRGALLEGLGETLSAVAHTETVAILTAVGLAVCIALGRWRNGAFLTGGVVGGHGLVHLLKDAIGRIRPDPDYVGSHAFPSGHANQGILLYTLLFFLVWDAYLRRRRFNHLPPAGDRQRDLAIAAGILALLAGLGRILQGVHWATDVAAGWGIGLFSAGATLWAFTWAEAKWNARTRPESLQERSPEGI